MMKTVLGIVGWAVVAAVASGSLWAHHSGAMYDSEHPITLEGTVTQFLFINPHVQIVFEAKDADGSMVKWSAGSGGPQRLYQRGWHKTTLKPGDKITVTGAPAKDGTKVMSVRRLVGPDGSILREGAE